MRSLSGDRVSRKEISSNSFNPDSGVTPELKALSPRWVHASDLGTRWNVAE